MSAEASNPYRAPDGLYIAPKQIHPEMKKPETFLDRLRARANGFAKILLDEIPELDAISFTFVYNQALGESVDPTALMYQRTPDEPLERARLANAIGQTAVIATSRLAVGFREALITLGEITKELNGKREAAQTSASEGAVAGGGDSHTGRTA